MTDRTDLAERIGLLSRWIAGTGITLLELTTPEETIRLVGGGASSAPAPVAEEFGAVVAAPSVGIFHRAHPLQADALTSPGQTVQAGDVVGLLRIGKLLLAVTTPHAGTVQEVLIADGTAVGYGMPLFRLRPTQRRLSKL